MNWKELIQKKPWMVALPIAAIILLMLAGCSKYVAPVEPPEVVWVDTLGAGIGINAICKDHVVCYRWSGAMSCIKDYTLSDKYCSLNNETSLNETGGE